MSAIVCQGIMSAQCESQLETRHNRIAVRTCTWCMKPPGQPALLAACVSSGAVLFLLVGVRHAPASPGLLVELASLAYACGN